MLGNGDVVRASPYSSFEGAKRGSLDRTGRLNEDLFHGAAGALETLGIVTLAGLRLSENGEVFRMPWQR